MREFVSRFTALTCGEKPGDPELGGWRPLPLHFFSRSSVTVEAVPLSLEKAVRIVAAGVARFQVRQAIEIVAQRLAN